MKLEEKLTSLRKEKGLTQLELAEAVHVTRQAVSRWEVGTSIPTTENLAYLSQIYGVPVDYLVNDREAPPKKEPPPADAGKAARRWTALALDGPGAGRPEPGGPDPGALRRRAAPEPAGGRAQPQRFDRRGGSSIQRHLFTGVAIRERR